MTCGAPLLESDTFCTKCGTKVGADAPASPQQTQNTIPTAKNNTVIILGVLSILWGIGALIFGAYLAASADSVVSNLSSSELDSLANAGIALSEVSAILAAFGAVLAISGVLGVITAILCFIRKFNIIAVVACIIASILGLVVIIGFIGFFVAYFIHKSKHSFTGHGHTL